MTYECPEGFGPDCRNPLCRVLYEIDIEEIAAIAERIGLPETAEWLRNITAHDNQERAW